MFFRNPKSEQIVNKSCEQNCHRCPPYDVIESSVYAGLFLYPASIVASFFLDIRRKDRSDSAPRVVCKWRELTLLVVFNASGFFSADSATCRLCFASFPISFSKSEIFFETVAPGVELSGMKDLIEFSPVLLLV